MSRPHSAGTPAALAGNHCQVHGYHWPHPQRTVQHHIIPLYLGGPDAPSNKVWICDTGHYSLHEAIDALEDGRPLPLLHRAEQQLLDRVVSWLDSQP